MPVSTCKIHDVLIVFSKCKSIHLWKFWCGAFHATLHVHSSFLHEFIWCRQNLVSTGCGHTPGQFAFHFLKLYHEKKLRNQQCQIRKHHNFELFGYENGCRRNIIDQINNCSMHYLTKQSVLKFSKDNFVIVRNSPDKIKTSCKWVALNNSFWCINTIVDCLRMDFHYSYYQRFQTCMSHISTSCPHGVRMIYDYIGDMRLYLSKMSYICSSENVTKGIIPALVYLM